jgi:cation transport ATPase
MIKPLSTRNRGKVTKAKITIAVVMIMLITHVAIRGYLYNHYATDRWNSLSWFNKYWPVLVIILCLVPIQRSVLRNKHKPFSLIMLLIVCANALVEYFFARGAFRFSTLQWFFFAASLTVVMLLWFFVDEYLVQKNFSDLYSRFFMIYD